MTVRVHHRPINGVPDGFWEFSDIFKFSLRTENLVLHYKHTYRNRWIEEIPRHLITSFEVFL